jgi:hypothetical protein
VQHPAGMADNLANKAGQSAPGSDRPTPESEPSAPHQDASDDVPIPMEEDDLLGEDMVDYEASPERPGMDVNVITFYADCTIVGDDEPVVAQFDFGPKEAAFTKPKESVNHLKPLFVRGHIDGIPIAKILVDRGAAINLMPYSLYRKLGKQDDELVKTNMTLSGVGTDSLIKARGVMSVELTIGTKTLAAAFFVADVEGNYSLILGRDWIHANQCIPSTLHQMLIQWVSDDIEQVHADISACIAVADAPVLWTYEAATCLTGVDFSDYQFISIDKKGDEDITSIHTLNGPITRSRAQHLNLQVRSTLVNCVSELTLGAMDVLIIRYLEEDQQGLRKCQGVEEEQQGRPQQEGDQVRLGCDSISGSRTSLH